MKLWWSVSRTRKAGPAFGRAMDSGWTLWWSVRCRNAARRSFSFCSRSFPLACESKHVNQAEHVALSLNTACKYAQSLPDAARRPPERVQHSHPLSPLGTATLLDTLSQASKYSNAQPPKVWLPDMNILKEKERDKCCALSCTNNTKSSSALTPDVLCLVLLHQCVRCNYGSR